MNTIQRLCFRLSAPLTALLLWVSPSLAQDPSSLVGSELCERRIKADVVALDQPFFFNRLGAHQPGGMIYALKRDVVSTEAGPELKAGFVALRDDLRPRPLTLRANHGDCLEIRFTNLLATKPVWEQPATRWSGLHIVGLSLVEAFGRNGERLDPIQADGSWVGTNPPSLVPPGDSITYVYRADEPGSYLMHSLAGVLGLELEADTQYLQYPTGQMTAGLFGAVNVQPKDAIWYRSQVTAEDLARATVGHTPLGQPIIQYDAKLDDGTPVLAMLNDDLEIVYGDVTAIVAYDGPDGPTSFPEDPDNPLFTEIPASPNRTQPYREITTIYHQTFSTVQAFDCAYRPPVDPKTGERNYALCKEPYAQKLSPYLYDALGAGEDRYAINYGSGGIGSEVLANRFEVGPAGKCTGCKYEEFFLSSWPNGDPGQVVTLPAGASAALGLSRHEVGERQRALFPADPSSVYHSYMWDHVKFRVLQGAANFHHLHHQHAHQWLHTPNAKTSHYLDSQAIAPGTSFTLEMVYNGSGNRNLTVGDAIFHCHFYPHFAEGMWSLWRVHDVMETGTEMAADGLPKAPQWQGRRLIEPGARALPDPEIARGTPIPAIVPLPDRPMPPMPATVTLDKNGTQAHTVVEVDGEWKVVGRDDGVDHEQVANPGFPFFIPGLAGQRAPRPPLDVAYAELTDPGDPAAGVPPTLKQASYGDASAFPLDGGLPRALITGSADPDGPGTVELHTRLDFSKVLQKIDAQELEEGGTAVEQIAMRAHAQADHPSCLPDGTCDPTVDGSDAYARDTYASERSDSADYDAGRIQFRLNGLPPIAGAPYADPCGVEFGARPIPDLDHGEETVATRHYRGANIQLDVVFNKEGWHFPQQRIITLWDDVEPTLNGRRAPEPFFFRANSRECVEYWQANLVPSEYALDDFQVRTPTDILGQHIHLVKFDVTSSDGAANGWNYEDGSLSPDEVRERIDAINAGGGLRGIDGERHYLEAKIHPRFGPGPRGTWIGAMTTVQRWMADPLLPGIFEGDDRTIRTVFTHDHFSPSTHQQAGLYAGLLVEPEGSNWFDSRTGELMGGESPLGEPIALREDGGPTSWRANIVTEDPALSFRELALEFQDITLAYPMASKAYPDPLAFGALNPNTALDTVDLEQSEIVRPLGDSPVPPWPQLVSTGGNLGTYSVNYRNEPLSPRLADRAGLAPANHADVPESQDVAYVFRSMERLRPEQNRQPPWYPPLTGGVGPTDPYTPLLQAYEGDRVQIRTLVGAHELVHHFTLRGLSWLAEPSYVDSGYKNHQVMGISEHFEMQFTMPPNPKNEDADFLYFTDVSLQGIHRGAWGILRSYDLGREKDFLAPLPNNPVRKKHQSLSGIDYCSPESLDPGDSRFQHRIYEIYALATEDFDEGVLTYSPESDIMVARLDNDGKVQSIDKVSTPIVNPEGLVYVHAEDVERIPNAAPGEASWRLKPGREFEPLVLRAAAGDCIEVRLTNYFDPTDRAFNFDLPGIGRDSVADPRCSLADYLDMRRNPDNFVSNFKADNRCFGSNKASTAVGLYPQLVSFDPTQSSGMNVGRNPVQTVKPEIQGGAGTHTSYWYAGKVEWDEFNQVVYTPVEFGSANLLSADVLHQHSKGLFGSLIIEPLGSSWSTDPGTRISATVTKKDGESFREHVLMLSDDFEIYWKDPGSSEGAVFQPVPVVSAEAVTAVNYSMDFLLFKLAPPAPWTVAVRADDKAGTPPEKLTIYDQTDVDQTQILVDQVHGGDPATPVFTAHAGDPVRFRILHPGGIVEGHVFTLNGHGWQERPYGHHENPSNPEDDPYLAIAQYIGDNELAEWKGQQIGLGPNAHFDAVIEPTASLPTAGAGGSAGVPGDYLYRTFPAVFFEGGFWGIFRVGPPVPDGEHRDVVAVTTATFVPEGARVPTSAVITGTSSSILGTDKFADRVTLFAGPKNAATGLCDGEPLATITEFTGRGLDRQWRSSVSLEPGTRHVCAWSSGGGVDDSPIFRTDKPARGGTVLSGPKQLNTVDAQPTPIRGASSDPDAPGDRR